MVLQQGHLVKPLDPTTSGIERHKTVVLTATLSVRKLVRGFTLRTLGQLPTL